MESLKKEKRSAATVSDNGDSSAGPGSRKRPRVAQAESVTAEMNEVYRSREFLGCFSKQWRLLCTTLHPL